MSTTTTKPPRGKPFPPGTSGNPKGRPRHAGRVAAMREAIAADVPAIVAVLTAAALAGDVPAARVLLDRAVAPLKATDPHEPVALPAGGPAAQAEAVAAALAAGALPPDRAAGIVAALSAAARLREHTDLMDRIERLEARLHGGAA